MNKDIGNCLNSNPCLTSCRSCCKFAEDEVYFAPKVTLEEKIALEKEGSRAAKILPFRKSKNVFQIKLIRSGNEKDVFTCPYLDSATHKCSVYNIRPFDCDFWPLIFMKDKSGQKTVLGIFKKSICPVTACMTKQQFEKDLELKLDKWFREKNVFELVAKYPDLVWDYEPDVSIIKEFSDI